MFHNHLVTLKKFLALTLNPVEVIVVRTVYLMLVLCDMLVHAGVASRAVGWPDDASSNFFLQVMQSRDCPQSVNVIAFCSAVLIILFEMECHGHGQSMLF